MAGIIVNKRCGLALARAVADLYSAHGFDNIDFIVNRGLFQVKVRGHRIKRMTPTGPCSSHGGGVPRLAALCPELHQMIAVDNQTHRECRT